MRKKKLRRLALAGGGEAPSGERDDLAAVIARVAALREALRAHMVGEMLRGHHRVELVGTDGKLSSDAQRQNELADIAAAQDDLRLELLKGLIEELPEPPKPREPVPA